MTEEKDVKQTSVIIHFGQDDTLNCVIDQTPDEFASRLQHAIENSYFYSVGDTWFNPNKVLYFRVIDKYPKDEGKS